MRASCSLNLDPGRSPARAKPATDTHRWTGCKAARMAGMPLRTEAGRAGPRPPRSQTEIGQAGMI
jgi:hypothetical protein